MTPYTQQGHPLMPEQVLPHSCGHGLVLKPLTVRNARLSSCLEARGCNPCCLMPYGTPPPVRQRLPSLRPPYKPLIWGCYANLIGHFLRPFGE